MKTTPLQQIFSSGLAKILLGTPIDPIFKLFGKSRQTAFRKCTLLPPETRRDTSKSPVPHLSLKKLDFKKLRSDLSKKFALLLETQQAVFCKVSHII